MNRQHNRNGRVKVVENGPVNAYNLTFLGFKAFFKKDDLEVTKTIVSEK